MHGRGGTGVCFHPKVTVDTMVDCVASFSFLLRCSSDQKLEKPQKEMLGFPNKHARFMYKTGSHCRPKPLMSIDRISTYNNNDSLSVHTTADKFSREKKPLLLPVNPCLRNLVLFVPIFIAIRNTTFMLISFSLVLLSLPCLKHWSSVTP